MIFFSYCAIYIYNYTIASHGSLCLSLIKTSLDATWWPWTLDCPTVASWGAETIGVHEPIQPLIFNALLGIFWGQAHHSSSLKFWLRSSDCGGLLSSLWCSPFQLWTSDPVDPLFHLNNYKWVFYSIYLFFSQSLVEDNWDGDLKLKFKSNPESMLSFRI